MTKLSCSPFCHAKSKTLNEIVFKVHQAGCTMGFGKIQTPTLRSIEVPWLGLVSDPIHDLVTNVVFVDSGVQGATKNLPCRAGVSNMRPAST
ncbi:hypothetical protein TNCV_4068631 [Trichonephila clavipes]|nr:hypothetical protein TNCV_4068631 [Trichonephila clavipes]